MIDKFIKFLRRWWRGKPVEVNKSGLYIITVYEPPMLVRWLKWLWGYLKTVRGVLFAIALGLFVNYLSEHLW